MMSDEPATAAWIVTAAAATYGGIESNQQRQLAKGQANEAERFRRRQEAEAKRQMNVSRSERDRETQLAALRARRAASQRKGYGATEYATTVGGATTAQPGKTAIGM